MHRRILVCALALLAVDGRAQRPNPGPSPRPDPAMETALKEITPLTTGEREDDHPAVAARGSTAWVVWVSYSETQGTPRILARAFDKGTWTATEAVSEAPGDYYKTAVAIDEEGG